MYFPIYSQKILPKLCEIGANIEMIGCGCSFFLQESFVGGFCHPTLTMQKSIMADVII